MLALGLEARRIRPSRARAHSGPHTADSSRKTFENANAERTGDGRPPSDRVTRHIGPDRVSVDAGQRRGEQRAGECAVRDYDEPGRSRAGGKPHQAATPSIRDSLGVALRSVCGILPANRRPVRCPTGGEKMRRLQSIGIAAFVCFATSSALAQITIGPFPIDGLQEDRKSVV